MAAASHGSIGHGYPNVNEYAWMPGVKKSPDSPDVHTRLAASYFKRDRLREAAATKSFDKPLAGEVEIDETFVGGKERNKHEWQRQHAGTGGVGKTAVFGMLERGGEQGVIDGWSW